MSRRCRCRGGCRRAADGTAGVGARRCHNLYQRVLLCCSHEAGRGRRRAGSGALRRRAGRLGCRAGRIRQPLLHALPDVRLPHAPGPAPKARPCPSGACACGVVSGARACRGQRPGSRAGSESGRRRCRRARARRPAAPAAGAAAPEEAARRVDPRRRRPATPRQRRRVLLTRAPMVRAPAADCPAGFQEGFMRRLQRQLSPVSEHYRHGMLALPSSGVRRREASPGLTLRGLCASRPGGRHSEPCRERYQPRRSRQRARAAARRQRRPRRALDGARGGPAGVRPGRVRAGRLPPGAVGARPRLCGRARAAGSRRPGRPARRGASGRRRGGRRRRRGARAARARGGGGGGGGGGARRRQPAQAARGAAPQARGCQAGAPAGLAMCCRACVGVGRPCRVCPPAAAWGHYGLDPPALLSSVAPARYSIPRQVVATRLRHDRALAWPAYSPCTCAGACGPACACLAAEHFCHKRAA